MLTVLAMGGVAKIVSSARTLLIRVARFIFNWLYKVQKSSHLQASVYAFIFTEHMPITQGLVEVAYMQCLISITHSTTTVKGGG